jgi:hypothetical protein
MNVDAALVKEQGVTFAVVVVNREALSPTQRDRTVAGLTRFWPGVPIVLMAQDSRGAPEYYGRSDIVKFLASVCK